MQIKKWLSLAIVTVAFGIAYVWIKGTPETNGRDAQVEPVSSNVPAPGPGQKKVLLRNLGMT
jgi:hypothetical protein